MQGKNITLAPKKLIRTRRASEGSASEPSLARRVSMCKDAKLSCRGNNDEPTPNCSQGKNNDELTPNCSPSGPIPRRIRASASQRLLSGSNGSAEKRCRREREAWSVISLLGFTGHHALVRAGSPDRTSAINSRGRKTCVNRNFAACQSEPAEYDFPWHRCIGQAGQANSPSR
jgi:hypothetical protein